MGLAERIDARKALFEAKKKARVEVSKKKWALRERIGKASKGRKKE